ncbi:hypothetical protein RND81_05G052700 [Saponaria officinalis]|uniref:Large ribosomal subunit protein uL6 alpha-beta domain-containing protein n=1 Tax=Saponaria officinalis TaxID=3572 RepID=A0AAW1KUV6_SAPOF
MKTVLSSDSMEIPEGVTIKVDAKMIEVEGPRGKLVRNFKHLNLDFQLTTNEDGKKILKIDSWFSKRKTTAAIRTAISHVENLITGVTKGYRYKMRMVYAHFPINASITNSNHGIEIRNFLGEKRVSFLNLFFFCFFFFCFLLVCDCSAYCFYVCLVLFFVLGMLMCECIFGFLIVFMGC